MSRKKIPFPFNISDIADAETVNMIMIITLVIFYRITTKK